MKIDYTIQFFLLSTLYIYQLSNVYLIPGVFGVRVLVWATFDGEAVEDEVLFVCYADLLSTARKLGLCYAGGVHQEGRMTGKCLARDLRAAGAVGGNRRAANNEKKKVSYFHRTIKVRK